MRALQRIGAVVLFVAVIAGVAIEAGWITAVAVLFLWSGVGYVSSKMDELRELLAAKITLTEIERRANRCADGSSCECGKAAPKETGFEP